MNSRINVQEVRLIASNGDQVGVVDTSKALELAKEEELDLVEIVPNQTRTNLAVPTPEFQQNTRHWLS